jgi:hypothetical protein
MRLMEELVQPFGHRHESIVAMAGIVISGGPRSPDVYMMLELCVRDWSKEIVLDDSTPMLRLDQAVEVSRGVKYLNLVCGVIHCDLKPDNVSALPTFPPACFLLLSQWALTCLSTESLLVYARRS